MRRQKNDGNDAEAIYTAARQPHIPFVPKKTVEQQDIQALHRARQRMVNHRTAVVTRLRHRQVHHPRALGDPGNSL